jgi:hypothetical protein
MQCNARLVMHHASTWKQENRKCCNSRMSIWDYKHLLLNEMLDILKVFLAIVFHLLGTLAVFNVVTQYQVTKHKTWCIKALIFCVQNALKLAYARL